MADDPDEYEIQYTTQKAIKGSVLADHLAHQAVEDYQYMRFGDIFLIGKQEVESRVFLLNFC